MSKFPTFREAEPGEFTRRALQNGKLDLVQAEGINDLINAESEQQVKLSLSQVTGTNSQIYQELRQELIRMLAHCEAYIDFEADELSDPRLSHAFVNLALEVRAFISKLNTYLKKSEVAETIREGFKISIIGPPNAGKSTLLNKLAQRKVAIVSDVPGTTRDLISVNLTLKGYNVILTDTAGLRQTQDQIESEGIQMAQDTARKSDAIIMLIDVNDLEQSGTDRFKLLDPFLQQQLADIRSSG